MSQNQCDTFEFNNLRTQGNVYSKFTPNFAKDGKVSIYYLGKVKKRQRRLITEAYESVGLKTRKAKDMDSAEIEFWYMKPFPWEGFHNELYHNTIHIDFRRFNESWENNTKEVCYEKFAYTQAVGKTLGLAMNPDLPENAKTVMVMNPDLNYLENGGDAGFTDFDKANITCMLENLN